MEGLVASEGHRFCRGCFRECPLIEFKSTLNRRTELTIRCNEEKKVIRISNIVHKREALFERHFQTEIPKCDLLCRNCHHIKTHY